MMILGLVSSFSDLASLIERWANDDRSFTCWLYLFQTKVLIRDGYFEDSD